MPAGVNTDAGVWPVVVRSLDPSVVRLSGCIRNSLAKRRGRSQPFCRHRGQSMERAVEGPRPRVYRSIVAAYSGRQSRRRLHRAVHHYISRRCCFSCTAAARKIKYADDEDMIPTSIFSHCLRCCQYRYAACISDIIVTSQTEKN